MDRRRAILILIAVLALVDLVGAALLREACSARQNKAASIAPPAAGAKPAVSHELGGAPALHSGI
jgi:hypothetical protein